MELDVLAIIGAMTWTVTATLKHLRAKAYHDALSLVVIVGVGIGVTFLVQASGRAFADSNAADIVLVGFAATSVLRATYEFKKAIDSSDSAAEPKLVPPPSPGG